jgi:hypothetical protein
VKFLYQARLFKDVPFAFPGFNQNVAQRSFFVTIEDMSQQCILSQTPGGSHPQIPVDECVSGQLGWRHQYRHDLTVFCQRICHAIDRLGVLDPDVVVTQFQVDNLNVFYPDVIFHA